MGLFEKQLRRIDFAYFDSQTKISFEQIKTSSKFCEINSGFVNSRLGVRSDEQVIFLVLKYGT